MDFNDISQMCQQLRSNPREVLAAIFNIPSIPSNVDVRNPYNIIQYFLTSGQVTQEQVNTVMKIKNPNDLAQYLLNTGQISQDQVNDIIAMGNNPLMQ